MLRRLPGHPGGLFALTLWPHDSMALILDPVPGSGHFQSTIGQYAHIEVVVACLVANFFVFLVITRDHGSFERRH